MNQKMNYTFQSKQLFQFPAQQQRQVLPSPALRPTVLKSPQYRTNAQTRNIPSNRCHSQTTKRIARRKQAKHSIDSAPKNEHAPELSHDLSRFSTRGKAGATVMEIFTVYKGRVSRGAQRLE
jgi:hypothetical protein